MTIIVEESFLVRAGCSAPFGEAKKPETDTALAEL